MTVGIRKMKALGFIDTTEKDGWVVRQFTRYDDKGYLTDLINYFYDSDTGVEVYVNNLKYQCGSRVDIKLLDAILVNFKEIEIIETFFKDILTKEGK